MNEKKSTLCPYSNYINDKAKTRPGCLVNINTIIDPVKRSVVKDDIP